MSSGLLSYFWAAIRPWAWGLFLGACVLALQTEAGASPAVPLQAPEETSLVDGAEEAEADSRAGVSVLDGVFTRGQASRGERRFQQVCGQCHRGNEFSSSVFRRSWADQTVGDLFDLILTTMADGEPGSLRPEEYAEIVAFILRSNGYPSGEEDLPTDLFQLETIRIVEAPE